MFGLARLARDFLRAPVSAAKVLLNSAIPFILAPNGSIADNGVITLGTALPLIYSRAFVYLPAGAIYTASPAGWYYATFSSTTVGVVYANTYTTGQPKFPTTPTAHVTTGPGSYTQVTAAVTAQNALVPAKITGVDGALVFSESFSYPANTNTKTISRLCGGISISSSVRTGGTAVNDAFTGRVKNRGEYTKQNVSSSSEATFSSTSAPVQASIDLSVAALWENRLQLGVATDYIVMESVSLVATPSY